MQDFSATVNMLTMLSKADLKLKSAMRDEDDDSGDDRGSGMERRSSSGGGALGRLRSRSKMSFAPPQGGRASRGRKGSKSKSDDGSKSGSRMAAAALTEGTSKGDGGSDILATHSVRFIRESDNPGGGAA